MIADEFNKGFKPICPTEEQMLKDDEEFITRCESNKARMDVFVTQGTLQDYTVCFCDTSEPQIPSLEDVTNFMKSDENPNFPLGEFDATKWAPEFKKIGMKLGYISSDVSDAPGDWLHTWFCAAIMTGYDYAWQEFRPLEYYDDEEYNFWGI